ncbi:hypothetical protein AB0M45_22020 [Nocardia sp. NPDC051787]|uniref:hypothetical protein n=1 Tax=Nocardia sp. NPDC051787 TaxID=3155415 RepID=UPI00342D5E10
MGNEDHCGIINRGDTLNEGDRLYSPNEKCRLGIRDGRMVREHIDSGTLVSSSGDQTIGTGIGLAAIAAPTPLIEAGP